MYFYEVAPSAIFRERHDILTYNFDEKLPIGTLVLVPIGQKTVTGLVLKETKKPIFPTKSITKSIYKTPLPKHLIKGIIWLKSYYSTPFATVLQSALPRGITKNRRQQKNTNHDIKPLLSTEIPLNSAQESAIQKINQCPSNTVLLHGITGSGKTNIYLTLARQQLGQQKSVILLVPEIALTSQLVASFQNHFKNIFLLHSKQTEAERHLTWENILTSNTPNVIIGPRSALFAPIKDLGLIIIDEAHEPAYHQDQSPKYSALRLASTMSRTVLGSATPSVADYYLCSEKSAIVQLDQLAINSDKIATTKIIDSTNRQNFKRHRLLSDELLESIEDSLKNKTQTLIFHNRRGSAPLTLCEHCGWQALCPNCLLPLTLHSDKFKLICHTCGQNFPVPTSCPTCGNANIRHKGFGTKYLESELNKLFTHARIARFDTDTEESNSLKNEYKKIKAGEIDIMIGTQMIAKGFDFPKLTTLGVAQADAGLSLPDFSSEERTFQLITQVIGRAKRGHQDSKIFIQTYQPKSPVINFAVNSDYKSFYDYAIKNRKKSGLPPFNFLLKLEMHYKTESAVIKNINTLSKNLARSFPTLKISKPVPAFHEHTPQGFCWQIIIKSKTRSALLSVISSLPSNPHLRFHIDPISLL